MKFKHVVHTDKGAVRQANEDAQGTALDTINGDIFVVCDGMGGHVGGALASSIAVRSILDYFISNYHENLIVAIQESFQFANTQIFAKTLEDPSMKGMGTTAVVLIIRENDIFIGHVGDSRIYVKSQGNLNRLTKDHSFVQQLVDNGTISDDEAENHPQKNQILKALGHSEEVKGTICEKAIKAKVGDIFLLCSDGQCGMVKDSTMYELISGDNLQASVENLYNTAMENGGVDNITNILIQITESPHMSSSFRNFNPVKTMPRNSDYEATGQVTIDAEDYQTHKKNSKTKYLIFGVVGSVVLATGLYFLLRSEDPKGGPEPPKPDIKEIKITKDYLEKKSEIELDKISDSISNGQIYICSNCTEGKIKNDKFTINLGENKKITLLLRNTTFEPGGTGGTGGTGGKGGTGGTGGKGGTGSKGGGDANSEQGQNKTISVEIFSGGKSQVDQQLEAKYKQQCTDYYKRKHPTENLPNFQQQNWKLKGKIVNFQNATRDIGTYTCDCPN